ncbi:MAG: hypothetical protein GIKADHBN_02348 [Phycisphaerales bacterium]|nr:hypothetical protein [Phycisphaerales bacterium]
MTPRKVDTVVEQIVHELLVRANMHGKIGADTNLHAAGLCSQDGVELACDLEARLGITVEPEFNPILHDTGKRMRTLAELQRWVQERVQAGANLGVAHE